VIVAIRVLLDPPPAFRGAQPSPWPVLLAVAAFVAAWLATRQRRHAVALVLLVAGVAGAGFVADLSLQAPSFHLPPLELPEASAFTAAFVLLVIPQLPLTFGDDVVEVSNRARKSVGWLARRVTPSTVSLTSGLANLVAGMVGGMPIGHASDGLVRHIRMGAQRAGMNLLLGTAFIVLGLFFAADVSVVAGLLPLWALSASLAYVGLRHALLVTDLRGASLAMVVVAGALGAALQNLAVTAALALLAHHGWRWVRQQGRMPARPGGAR
jgi:sulfate permease, SulP family